MADREQLVMDTFVDLADTLASDYDVGEFLHMLVERCAEVLQVATAGVLLESAESGELELAASTSEAMQQLEQAEIDHQEGPCLEAYRAGEQVVAHDLEQERERWPNVIALMMDMGLRAVYAFPLRLRDDVIGALNLYRDEPGAFEEDDIRLAQAFADVAAIGILQKRKVTGAEKRAGQLQRALDSRIPIEQAKGVLAERAGITPQQAFDRMRAHARNNNEKLRAVCGKVLDSDFVPD